MSGGGSRTLRREISVAGVGIHSGASARVRMRPARFGSGIVFLQQGEVIPAVLANARAEPGCTVLAAGRGAVYTPEHLLAALCALGVTDVGIEIEGPELPALDGSAALWVAALDEAGLVEGPSVRVPEVTDRVEVEAAGGVAVIEPGDEISVEVDFAGGPSGALRVPRTEARFRSDIMWARTFVREADAERMRALGRGKGASPENTVLWPTSEMRAPDEPVRHKLLDAWGDLALLGPSKLAFSVCRGSHALHLAALSRLTAGGWPLR